MVDREETLSHRAGNKVTKPEITVNSGLPNPSAGTSFVQSLEVRAGRGSLTSHSSVGWGTKEQSCSTSKHPIAALVWCWNSVKTSPVGRAVGGGASCCLASLGTPHTSNLIFSPGTPRELLKSQYQRSY